MKYFKNKLTALFFIIVAAILVFIDPQDITFSILLVIISVSLLFCKFDIFY